MKQRLISCATKASAKSGKQPLTTARNQSYCSRVSESLSSARSLYPATPKQARKINIAVDASRGTNDPWCIWAGVTLNDRGTGSAEEVRTPFRC